MRSVSHLDSAVFFVVTKELYISWIKLRYVSLYFVRLLLKITEHYLIAFIQMLRDVISKCCEKYAH